MKYKILLFLFIVFALTGCSRSELTCSKKSKNAGYVYNEIYELIYANNNENLEKINLTMEYDYNERYTAEEISEEYSEAVKYCNFYGSGSQKFIKCEPNLDDDMLTIDVIIEVNKIDDELFEDIMYVSKDEINNLKDTKKMLENVGYSCK